MPRWIPVVRMPPHTALRVYLSLTSPTHLTAHARWIVNRLTQRGDTDWLITDGGGSARAARRLRAGSNKGKKRLPEQEPAPRTRQKKGGQKEHINVLVLCSGKKSVEGALRSKGMFADGNVLVYSVDVSGGLDPSLSIDVVRLNKKGGAAAILKELRLDPDIHFDLVRP